VELLIIPVVFLLVYGSRKLPGLIRSAGAAKDRRTAAGPGARPPETEAPVITKAELATLLEELRPGRGR